MRSTRSVLVERRRSAAGASLLLHFALVFPERTEAAQSFLRSCTVYGPPLAPLLCIWE